MKTRDKLIKKECLPLAILTLMFILLILIGTNYSLIFKSLYGGKIKTKHAVIVLSSDFFFIPKAHKFNKGISDIADIYISYSAYKFCTITDISGMDYEKTKKRWIVDKGLLFQKKKWKNLTIEEFFMPTLDLKDSEFLFIVIPDLKIMLTFYRISDIPYFFENVRLSRKH